MAKGKVMKSSSTPFVKGGSGHMFGKQTVGPKTPGVTGKADKGGAAASSSRAAAATCSASSPPDRAVPA